MRKQHPLGVTEQSSHKSWHGQVSGQEQESRQEQLCKLEQMTNAHSTSASPTNAQPAALETNDSRASRTSCSLSAEGTSCTTCRSCKNVGVFRWLFVLVLGLVWWCIPAPASAQAVSTKGEANLAPWVGIGSGGLQVGVNYNFLHLTSHVDLTLGLQTVDIVVLSSATAGLEYVLKFDHGRFGINPYVHAGTYYNSKDCGVGIAMHLQGNSPWGMRLEYRVSRNYYAFAGMGLTYRF